MNNPVREYLPFMPEWTLYVMYPFLIVIFALIFIAVNNKRKNFGFTFSELFSELAKVFKNNRQEIMERFATYVLGQKKVRRMRYTGIMHMFIFYSMILLFIGTFLIFLEQDVFRFFGVESFINGTFYIIYEIILDVSGLLLIAGLLMALYRRIVIKPEYVHSTWVSYFVLWSLLFIGVTGFVMEGIRLTLHPTDWGIYSFVGYSLSLFLKNLSAEFIGGIYASIWWSHFIVVMAFLLVVPVTALKHMILIPLNLILLPVRESKAKMTTPFNIYELEDEEDDENGEFKVGISCAEDLNWQQKLNLAACINCGRCESVCPAYASGRELSPRALVQKMKSSYDRFSLNLQEQHTDYFESGLITENEVWSCTNCGACVEECPAMINHVDYIIDLRRHLVNENKLDDKKAAVFSSIDQNYNPLGLPSYKRNEWLAESGVPLLENKPEAEYLYWIGDMGSFDPRVQNVVKSVLGILEVAGIDFAILTHEEKYCGEILKRMGEEGRYQILAMENIEMLNSYGVKKIITHDPHTYNMLLNEYPEFGGKFEVIHHSVLMQKLLKEKAITIESKSMERIVFHDSCNLSRWNNIIDEPREVLSNVMEKELLEIEESKERTFCCGAGGGNYWYKVPEQEKISSIRLKQLSVVEPETIALGCPYCLLMLEDAVRTSDNAVKVRDIAEIVYDHVRKVTLDSK